MALIHDVIDSDVRFVIDPVKRTISNQNSTKLILIQGDHNSERFSFEIPRIVEGHDMSLCNMVRIHYINTCSKTRSTSCDIYEPDDMAVSNENDQVVHFSWLIPGSATVYAGSLAFAIEFQCIVDDKIVYSWHTAPNTTITISDGISNTEVIAEEYADILMTWWLRIYANATLPIEIHSMESFAALNGETAENTLYMLEDDPTLAEIEKVIEATKEFDAKLTEHLEQYKALDKSMTEHLEKYTELDENIADHFEDYESLLLRIDKLEKRVKALEDDSDSEECEHSYTSVVTAPTCTEQGYTVYTCSKCGNTYKDDYIEALGHTYVDGVCTACGTSEPTIPSTGEITTYVYDRSFSIPYSGTITSISCPDFLYYEDTGETLECIALSVGDFNVILYNGDNVISNYAIHAQVMSSMYSYQYQGEKNVNQEWIITAPSYTGTAISYQACSDNLEKFTDSEGNDCIRAKSAGVARLYYYWVNSYTDSGFIFYTYKIIEKGTTCSHNNTTIIPATAATCTTAGATEGLYCNDCKTIVTKQDTVPATGHTYVDGVCTVCGVSETICTEHVWVYTQQGPDLWNRHCSVCKTEEIDVEFLCTDGTAHSWVETTSIPATCTTPSIKQYYCSKCDVVKTGEAVGEALGHTMAFDTSVNQTCTEAGSLTMKCSVCGHTEITVVPATGHTWVYTQDGPDTWSRECSVCGASEINVVYLCTDGTAHSWVETTPSAATCISPSTKRYYCSKCDAWKFGEAVGEALGHTKGTPIYDVVGAYKPTCTVKGYAAFVCTVCGKEFWDTVPATGHTWGEIDTSDRSHTCTTCGTTELIIDQTYEQSEGGVFYIDYDSSISIEVETDPTDIVQCSVDESASQIKCETIGMGTATIIVNNVSSGGIYRRYVVVVT